MKTHAYKTVDVPAGFARGLTGSCLSRFILAGLLLGISLPALATSVYSPPTAGLIGWWRGDGDATDSSGHGHNGTLQNGMGFTSGLFGQAFAAGSGQRVLIADSPEFQLTSSLTIGAWMNMSGNSWAILFRGDARPGLDPWALSGDSLGHMGFQIDDATDTGVYLPVTLPLNQWVQVTGTLDGSTGDMRIYFNGVLAGETFTTIRPFGPLDPTQQPGVAIGNTPVYNFPFSGAIDEVVLYNRALSPSEVMALVPEPGSLSLLLSSGLLWAWMKHRRREGIGA